MPAPSVDPGPYCQPRLWPASPRSTDHQIWTISYGFQPHSAIKQSFLHRPSGRGDPSGCSVFSSLAINVILFYIPALGSPSRMLASCRAPST
eukprot:4260147-Amphidinium_carterae.1